jgi:hypothetical protein
MYTPLNLLADYIEINQRRHKFQDRWKTNQGKHVLADVEQAMAEGGGQSLLDVIANGPSGFFEDSTDLRGMRIVEQNFNEQPGEFFRDLTLNYARWRDVEFNHLSWRTVTANFIDAMRVKFHSVSFVRLNSYGADFEDCTFVDCNFLERNTFSNCTFKNVVFVNCFFATDAFVDCKFDELTRISGRAKRSHAHGTAKTARVTYNLEYDAPFYRGLRDAYEAGRISNLARAYLFREKQALTRHNTPKRSERLARYFLEYATGYGIKPLRVLASVLVLLALFTSLFATAFGERGFLLSVGGFFTFGANTGYLENAAAIYQFLYSVEAFLGVTTMSTFIVVMTNYWASLR